MQSKAQMPLVCARFQTQEVISWLTCFRASSHAFLEWSRLGMELLDVVTINFEEFETKCVQCRARHLTSTKELNG